MASDYRQPEWQTYIDEMALLGHGVAMWKPATSHSVQIGDVGYFDSGNFVRIFNVLRAIEPAPHSDDSEGLETFDAGTVVQKTPRRPGALHSASLVGTDSELDHSAGKFVIRPLTPGAQLNEAAIWSHLLSPEPHALGQLHSTSRQGAALVTKYKTIREDTPHPLLFREYLLTHSEALLERARSSHPDISLERLIFVTGRDMTGDHATFAFNANTDTLNIRFVPKSPLDSGSNTEAWGSWLVDPAVAVGSPTSGGFSSHVSGSANEARTSKSPERSYCVFVRGYRMRARGCNSTKSSPLLSAETLTLEQSERESEETSSDHLDRTNYSDEFTDPLKPFFDYIFAEQSDARLAIVHDKDLRLLLRIEGNGSGDEVMTLLHRIKPGVDVNSNGVASIHLTEGSGTGSNSAGPSRSPSIASRLTSPILRRARASTTSLASALFQPQTQHEEKEKLVNKEVTGSGEFSTLPSSSSREMEAQLGRSATTRPSLTFSPPNGQEFEPERGRARRVATPLSLSSSFGWFNRSRTDSSLPRASHTQTPMLPIEELIQALTPPAVPLPQHARALAHALASEDTDVRPAAINPILSSLCAPDSPSVLQTAGWDIMAAFWHKVEQGTIKAQPMTSERLAHFSLIIQDQPWSTETWEPRYKALASLMTIPSSMIGVEKELVVAVKSWMESAFGKLISHEDLGQEERMEHEHAVEVLSALLMDLFANVEIASRLSEEELGSLMDSFGSMIDRSLELRSVQDHSPQSATPIQTSRPPPGNTPTRVPYGHRRHPSSLAVPTASTTKPSSNPPLDCAIAVFVNFLSTRQHLVPLDRLSTTLALLFRSLAHYISPLPVPSVPSDAQLHRLSEHEKTIVKNISSFLAGRFAASSIAALKDCLRPPETPQQNTLSAQLTSMGAFRTLRLHIRQVLRERLIQPVERPRNMFPSIPDLGDEEGDIERTASAGWEPGRFRRVLRESVRAWIDTDCSCEIVEPILEEAAGILSDILHVFDGRENDAMGTDEAIVVGETLQELAQYFRLLKLSVVPLAIPKDAPTSLARTISTLLARGHTSTPIQPPLTTILLSMAAHLSDSDLAAVPTVMAERQSLSPTAPDWLDNWQLLLNCSTLHSRARPQTRKTVASILHEVYDTVKDMPEYRKPLSSLLLDTGKRQVHSSSETTSDTIWELLSQEVVLRSIDVEHMVVKYDEEEETRVDNIDPEVEAIVAFLESVATTSEDSPMTTRGNSSDTSPRPSEQLMRSSVTSPSLSRRQSDFHGSQGPVDRPQSSVVLNSPSRTEPGKSLVQGAAFVNGISPILEPPQSPLARTESSPMQATSALVTALGHLIFTSVSLSQHNLVTAVRIYRVLIDIALGAKSSRARLAAWQLLLRLRGDRNHRLFFAHDAHEVDDQRRTLASQIGRVSQQDPGVAADVPEEKPRSTYQGRGSTQSKATSSRSRSRAARQEASNSFSTAPRESLWSFPEQLPFDISDRPISSARLTSYDPVGPGKRVVLPLSEYLNALSKLLLFESDWEILSYVLCHLPSQLSNKHLICGPKCRIATAELLDTLCSTIQSGEFGTSIEHWPAGVKRNDATSLAYHTLSVLISYRQCFKLHQQNVLVEVFCLGLGAQPSTNICCLQALSLAAFDLQPSMTRYLVQILDKLAQIMSSPAMPVHILNFVAIVGSIRSLHANFTREHFKKVFVVALKYLQDHNRRGSSLAGSWALSQHVRIMSYAVIYTWFLAVQLSDRADHVSDITRGLLEANEGNPEIDEPTEVCFDWLARYTYASADPRPAHSLLDEIVMNSGGRPAASPPRITEKTWLMGSSAIVTIRALPKHGWVEVIARRPSGLTKFLCKSENVPVVGPGDVDPDMLSLPGVLMMDRDASDGAPELHEGGATPGEGSGMVPHDATTALDRPDPMTGYVWSGTAPSQRRKDVAIDPSYFALQLSPYPSNYTIARGTMVTDLTALARFLRIFDKLPVIDTHKVGVLYVAPGQTEQDDILRNTHGSPAYTRFLEGIGRLVNLKGQKDVYAGGLDADIDGEYAYAWWDDIGQILFHTATLMPTTLDREDENRHRKMMHIGNDYVRIVWNDSGVPYNFETVRTQFQFVNIVIEAHSRGTVAAFSNNLDEKEYFKVTVQRAPGMIDFLPIGDFKVISAESLPLLVRQLSLLSDWFSNIFLFTERDTRHEEVQTNWRERLRSIRRFSASVRKQAEAANEGDEPRTEEGIMAQLAVRDFSSSY